jgi:hypothetical protein
MPKYFEFEVSLMGVEPKIFRQFALPIVSTFADLHNAIQRVCSWNQGYCYVFRTNLGPKGKEIAGTPLGSAEPRGHKNGAHVKLYAYFSGVGKRCVYEYDSGDCWYHAIKLIRIFQEDEFFKRKLLGGARAFPPENCGGIAGYERSCQLLSIPPGLPGDDPQRRKWLGEWTPEAFDFEKMKKKFETMNSKDKDGSDACVEGDSGDGNEGDETDHLTDEIFEEQVQVLITQGKKGEAVRLVQDYLKIGLKYSKDWVEALKKACS